jgi:hypothetical protein
MRLRSLSTVLAALAVAGLAGCGSSSTPGTTAAKGAPKTTAPALRTDTTIPLAPGSSAKPGTVTGSAGTTVTKPGASKPSAATKPGTKPKPSAAATYGDAEGVVPPGAQGSPQEVPIAAKVTPACVARGKLATLTVETTPKSTMTYVAIYNGEKSGAAKPWGDGYGGNDQGIADYQGNATFTWVVGVDAPTGPARVLLVVATGNKQRAINVPFSVSEREADGCGT